MKRWTVEMTEEAESQLRADLLRRLLTPEDVRFIKRWVLNIESLGLKATQKLPEWRDHPLQGKWFGYRSVSFSYSGRIIYRVENEQVIVRVVRVTPDHDYT